ncbi:MAG: HAD family hydrolase [Planctomycetota bacterium]
MIEAVIFDLFGTLVHLTRDSRPYFRLCRQTRSERRIRDSQTIRAETLLDFCRSLQIDPPDDFLQLQQELDADIASIEMFSDSLETLQKVNAAGVRVGLLSNLASPYRSCVKNLGLNQYIDNTVYSCDVGFAKPAREIYEIALQGLDVLPENCLMVGDSLRCDVEGPKAVGMRGLRVDRNATQSGGERIARLSDVLEHLSS